MLRVTLDVNGQEIGTIKILQIETLPKGWRRYRAYLVDNDTNKTRECRVTHKRSDGAYVLVRKVLEEMGF